MMKQVIMLDKLFPPTSYMRLVTDVQPFIKKKKK